MFHAIEYSVRRYTARTGTEKDQGANNDCLTDDQWVKVSFCAFGSFCCAIFIFVVYQFVAGDFF